MSFSRGAFLSAVQLYSQSLNFPFFFTPRVTVCILLSLMTVFSSRGFGFSSTAIFFLSSFHYMHCHLVTVFMSCLLFSLTVNNLFFISGLYCHVFIGFLGTNFSCHLCWWRFLFSPDFRSSADAVNSSATESWALCCCRCDLSLRAVFIIWMSLCIWRCWIRSQFLLCCLFFWGRGVELAYSLYKLV